MEALLLGIYSFFVWLIFFKFKWLPWNTTSQVTVAIIPIVALTVLILTLTSDTATRGEPAAPGSSSRLEAARRRGASSEPPIRCRLLCSRW